MSLFENVNCIGYEEKKKGENFPFFLNPPFLHWEKNWSEEKRKPRLADALLRMLVMEFSLSHRFSKCNVKIPYSYRKMLRCWHPSTLSRIVMAIYFVHHSVVWKGFFVAMLHWSLYHMLVNESLLTVGRWGQDTLRLKIENISS